MTHSPGPWRANGIDIFDNDNRYLASIWGKDDMPDKTDEANARLIAAAPAMLAELSGAVTIMQKALADLRVVAPEAISVMALESRIKSARTTIAEATR